MNLTTRVYLTQGELHWANSIPGYPRDFSDLAPRGRIHHLLWLVIEIMEL